MVPSARREATALKYEGKTFLKEEDGVVVGCQVNGCRAYCSACDWEECWDRERASFPPEVA